LKGPEEFATLAAKASGTERDDAVRAEWARKKS